MSEAKTVSCELSRVLISETDGNNMIVLRALDGERQLPIAIGFAEAFAINCHITGEHFPRPLTHDLLITCLDSLGGHLKEVVIHGLEESPDGFSSTFHALLVIESGDTHLEIDARPSDAIACAVRVDCPIKVSELVFQAQQGMGPQPGS